MNKRALTRRNIVRLTDELAVDSRAANGRHGGRSRKMRNPRHHAAIADERTTPGKEASWPAATLIGLRETGGENRQRRMI
jgi:hypothetical protein